jgi:hypothetical protein
VGSGNQRHGADDLLVLFDPLNVLLQPSKAVATERLKFSSRAFYA